MMATNMQVIETSKKISLNYNEQIGLKGIIKDLTERYTSIKKILLYGSKAKGGFLDDSDIDLLFITDTEIPRQVKNQISDIIYNYELANNIVVSAIYVSESDFINKISPFLIRVRKEGIIIWSRE